jgi:hypothetical protein
MKRIILIMTVIIIFLNFVKAQDSDERDKIHFGVKVGTNYSNIYDIKGQDFTAEYKWGVAGGVFLSLPLGEYLGIRPEVLYSQKGYQSTGSILGASYKITHTSDFLDIPILLEIKPTEVVTVVVGPQYSYLMTQKNKFSSSLLTTQQQQDFDNSNIRKNTLCATGGLDFNLKPLVIGLRAGWDVLHNNGDGTSTSPRYRNVWYQATLGVRF